MSSPTVTIVESQSTQAIPDPGIDKVCVIIGCTSGGTAGLSALRLNPTALVTDYTGGDTVDVCTHLLTPTLKRRNVYPLAIYKTPSTNPGSYRTIDITGVTGTAVLSVDATSTPLGTYDAWLKTITGFSIGTSGGAIQWSLDGGRHWSDTIAIGTAGSYTIPNSGVKYLLGPSTADNTLCNTLLNEIKVDINAHFILVTGLVHTNSGVADVIATTNATNTATRVALANAERTALISHYGKGSGASPAIHINVSGDAAGAATLTATPVATDDASALALALVMKAVQTTHIASTVFHTIADATNTITSTSPAQGTLVANDVAKVRTDPPVWSQADLTTAFAALAASSIDFALVAIVGNVAAADATIISAGLNALLAVGKRDTCFVHTRGQLAAESESTWQASIVADYASFTDARIGRCDGQAWITNPYTGRQDLRSFIAPTLARVTTIDRWVSPGYVNDGPLEGVSLVDQNDALIGHDEGPMGNVTGLDNARGICLYRIPTSTLRAGAYIVTSPQVLWGVGDKIRHVQIRRVANAMEREAEGIAWTEIGGAELGDADTLLLDEATTDAIANKIKAKLSVDFAADVQNPKDEELVVIDRPYTVSNVTDIAITGSINPRPFGYAKSITLNFRINGGA